MSERTREVPKLGNATYVHTQVIESIHKYKHSGLYCPELNRGQGRPSLNHIVHGPCMFEYFQWSEYEHRLGPKV